MESNNEILYISKSVGKRPATKFGDVTAYGRLEGYTPISYMSNLKLWCNLNSDKESNLLFKDERICGDIFITGEFNGTKLTGIDKDIIKDILMDLIAKDISIDSDNEYKPSDLFIELGNHLSLEPSKFSFLVEGEVPYGNSEEEFQELSKEFIDNKIKKVISIVFKDDKKDVDTIFKEITTFVMKMPNNWFIVADMVDMYERVTGNINID